MMRSAVVQKLTIIGEAASRISEGLKSRHSEIPWPKIVGFRNILVHAYFGVAWEEVWWAAKRDCPTIREQVAAIVAELGSIGPAPEK